jgi:hypothetical protein
LTWSEVVELFAGTKADIGLTAILTKQSEQINRSVEMDRYKKLARLTKDRIEDGKVSVNPMPHDSMKVTGMKARQTLGTWGADKDTPPVKSGIEKENEEKK